MSLIQKIITHGAKLLIVALVCTVSLQSAFANDDLVCPAVFPCDEFGELKSEYLGLTDECSLRFATKCKELRILNKKECSALSDDYNDLQAQSEARRIRVKKLQKELRKLRKATR